MHRMGHSLTRRLFLLALVSSLIFLFSFLRPESEYRKRISLVDEVTTPDRVQAGHSIVVTITTRGLNGCWKQGQDDVRRLSNGYLITPQDYEYIGPNYCTAVIVQFTHEVTLVADQVGTHEIRIQHCIRYGPGQETIGTIIREVTVY